MNKHRVGIIMGSDSDFPIMEKAITIFEEQGIDYEVRIISAHRTPKEMLNYAEEAKERGYDIIIAGAGGAAHLPGMTASMCSLPVIGVPVRSRSMDGVDSVLSILQMPAGIPVATVGVNNARGAAKLAVRMLHCYDSVDNVKENGEQVQPHVKIVFDEKDSSREDLAKVIETLAFYGLGHEMIDIIATNKEFASLRDKLETAKEDGAIAILNLANIAYAVVEEIHGVTTLPVLFVPIKSNVAEQTDEFEQALQTVEDIYKMSNKINEHDSPLAVLAVNGYQNAGIMLARIAGIHSTEIYNRVTNHLEELRVMVTKKDADMSARFSDTV